MSDNLSHDKLWRLWIDGQIRTHSPLLQKGAERLNASALATQFCTGIGEELLKRSETFSRLCLISDNIRQKDTLRFDYEDIIDDSDDSSGDVHVQGSAYLPTNVNTSTEDINKENSQFNAILESRSSDFVRELIWTEFEDGVENEITRLVLEYVKRNKYVTYCWLYKLFNENRSNSVITSGLLRTLGMVVDIQDAGYLMTMVTAGLSSLHAEDQEAAIMVVEKWRTKECLDAMVNTSYGSHWIKEYANQVIHELREELEV